MQSLIEHLLLSLLEAESEQPTNTTAGVANPDNPFKSGSIAGHKYVEVDHDTYVHCQLGKIPYAKWDGYIEDEQLRTFVQKHYSSAKSLLVVNRSSGVAAFLRKPK